MIYFTQRSKQPLFIFIFAVESAWRKRHSSSCTASPRSSPRTREHGGGMSAVEICDGTMCRQLWDLRMPAKRSRSRSHIFRGNGSCHDKELIKSDPREPFMA